MAKGKAKASPPQKKPKGKLSAYMVFVKSCTENEKNENPGKKLVLKEFTQSCSKLWKEMSEEDKQPFKDLAEQDKRRFEDEKAEYDKENPTTSKGKEGKAKPVKDKNAPKKPLSSYMLFCQDQRPILKASHPNLKFTEVAKTLGEKWKAIDEPTRAEYNKRALREKERYAKAMDKYDPNIAGSSKGKAVSKTPVKRPAKGSTQSAKKRQKVEKESSEEEESSDEESSVEEAAKESSDEEEESDESESESNAQKSGNDKKDESSAEESDEESEIDD